jgi:hypothetical protein
MIPIGRIGTSAGTLLVAALLMLAIQGSSAPTLLTSCNDPFVYDPHLDEVIPAEMVQGLESATPPVLPGDPRKYHFSPWEVFCQGVPSDP